MDRRMEGVQPNKRLVKRNKSETKNMEGAVLPAAIPRSRLCTVAHEWTEKECTTPNLFDYAVKFQIVQGINDI